MSPYPSRPGLNETKARRHEILRVDHAGELGAVYIYRAQAAVFAGTKHQALSEDLQRMEADEAVHLQAFEARLRAENVRPTVLAPLWRLAAMGLGTATALMGEKAAHACTAAVESIIEAHYQAQITELATSDPDLSSELKAFRDDELGHRDHAVAQGAQTAPGYEILSAIIKTGCLAAIKISEKI
jgi:3-demethoxyubiquinol 3-hydroxylase